MAIYTFRPDKTDGASQLLRFVNLPSDKSAKVHARTVLDVDSRFRAVQIWDGERLVDSVARGA
jgi:hypothetical protein